jgi:predicted nucleotidyltransferase
MNLDIRPDASDNARARYDEAIASLLAKLQQDRYVLAVVLYGSLAYDVVWDKSDIDLCIITQETKQKPSGLTLVEDGINIHAEIVTRSEFKKMMEGAVQSSFTHSMLIKGRLLFTRDETLEALWANRQQFGARDREIRLLSAAVLLVLRLTKAQKWLHVKGDPHYSFVWILKCLDELATIETVLAGEITGREVLWQAMHHNPAFFRAVYTDLIEGAKTREAIGAALTRIESYLRERVPLVFRPILDHLEEAGGIRSARDIDHYFRSHLNFDYAAVLCEWLAEERFIQEAALPARLTERSRVDVEEAAYFYDGGGEPFEGGELPRYDRYQS